MPQRHLTNLPASVHQRLLNLARESKRPFNELLQYYAMERFLFRLGLSPYANRFVLKGALMLRVWHLPLARPTMDIDMLGRTLYTVENLVGIMQQCLVLEVPDDGVRFDESSVQGEPKSYPLWSAPPTAALWLTTVTPGTLCASLCQSGVPAAAVQRSLPCSPIEETRHEALHSAGV